MPEDKTPESLSLAWAFVDHLRGLGFGSDAISVGIIRTVPGASTGTVTRDAALEPGHAIRVEVGPRGRSCGFTIAPWPMEPGAFAPVWAAILARAEDTEVAATWRTRHRFAIGANAQTVRDKLNAFSVHPNPSEP